MSFVRKYVKIDEKLNTPYKSWNAILTRDGKFQKQQEMEEKFRDVCTAHEKELADMNAANAVLKALLDKTRAGSEACEKEKEKAEKQIEELMKKLSDFEKDMAVGTQVCNTHSLFIMCSAVVKSVH